MHIPHYIISILYFGSGDWKEPYFMYYLAKTSSEISKSTESVEMAFKKKYIYMQPSRV